MRRKTDLVTGTAQLDGDNIATALGSVENALVELAKRAQGQGREVLWDTLELGVEREQEDTSYIDAEVANVATWTTITASALAVLR